MYLHRQLLHLPVALNPKELVGDISIMIYRLSLSTYVNTLLLNKALVLSNRPGPTDTQTPLTYMYRYSQEFA